MSKIYGYCRVSTKSQKLERQIDNISKAYPTAILFKEKFTGVSLFYRVVLISGVQQSESVIHIHIDIWIIFQRLFPCRLLHSTEQISLCCTVDPCYVSILYIIMCIC